MSASNFLVLKCHEGGYKNVQTSTDILCSDFVFILDEAQYTYPDAGFWYNIIKSAVGLHRGPRFCIFSSYGSPTTGAPEHDYPACITPPILGLEQRVSLTVSCKPGAPDVCLFYDSDEFNDVVGRYCKMPTIEFTLDTDVRDYLFSLTNGHPGMVYSVLGYIRRVGATRP